MNTSIYIINFIAVTKFAFPICYHQANVLAILAVAIRQTDFLRIMQLSSQYAGFVYPCMGIHPVQVRAETFKQWFSSLL